MNAQTQSDWIPLVAAGLGAFLGSVSAFALEALRQWRRERALKHSALMTAQFVLSMQLNTLVSIDNQYLRGVAKHPQRFAQLPLFYLEVDDTRIDFSSLAFIATRDRIEVLQKVHMAQAAFLTAIGAISHRNRILEDIYAMDTNVTAFDFETGQGTVDIDERKARVLKGATDGLYGAVESGIELLQLAIAGLGETSKGLFPKRKVVSIEFASADAQSTSS